MQNTSNPAARAAEIRFVARQLEQADKEGRTLDAARWESYLEALREGQVWPQEDR
jgi:hypothetical protein